LPKVCGGPFLRFQKWLFHNCLTYRRCLNQFQYTQCVPFRSDQRGLCFLLFLRNLFWLLGSDVDLFVLGRLFEISDPFSESLTDLREFPSTKNIKMMTKMTINSGIPIPNIFFLLFNVIKQAHLPPQTGRNPLQFGGSAWESNPPRTSLPVTGFEVQEAHQNLSTSKV
jgi:hypothetical protein